jgi:dephospho-CoA kinase
MKIIGLTGSIGMGKSTIAALFIQAGVPLFDADAVVHWLQGPNGRLLPEIEARFPGTTGPGGVDRLKLGEAVFGNAEALAALEAIVHPAVAAMQKLFLRKNRARAFVVVDIPLLFEKRGWRKVDMIVVVSASAWQQRKRVLARKAMTRKKFARIKRLQTSDAIKRARADVVINTGRQLVETKAQVRRLITCLSAKTSRYQSAYARNCI